MQTTEGVTTRGPWADQNRCTLTDEVVERSGIILGGDSLTSPAAATWHDDSGTRPAECTEGKREIETCN